MICKGKCIRPNQASLLADAAVLVLVSNGAFMEGIVKAYLADQTQPAREDLREKLQLGSSYVGHGMLVNAVK